MSAKKDAFAALLKRAKELVIASFDFDRALSIMTAVSFGWVPGVVASERSVHAHALMLLEDLIDSTIKDALKLSEEKPGWGCTWTSSGGFIVLIFEHGIMQAHMTLTNSDSYDYDELLPLYQAYDAACGKTPPPLGSFEYGGRLPPRRLLLNK